MSLCMTFDSHRTRTPHASMDNITRIKNIKDVTRCRDSRLAKSIETRCWLLYAVIQLVWVWHKWTWKNGVVKEAIVLQWMVQITSSDFKPCSQVSYIGITVTLWLLGVKDCDSVSLDIWWYITCHFRVYTCNIIIYDTLSMAYKVLTTSGM